MSTQPLRPTGASASNKLADAFGGLAMELRGPKKILRAPEPPPKPKR